MSARNRMKLKLDANGNVVLKDGMPVYVNDKGDEVAVDVPHLFAKIPALQKEAKEHREAKEKAEGLLKAFEGLDAEKAKEALKVVKNLEDGKLIEAGKVDQVKAEVTKVMQEKIDAAEKQLLELQDELRAEKIGGRFARSKF